MLFAMLKSTDKKTFRYSAVGYVISIAGAVASNPATAKSVVRLFSELFRPFLGGQPLLPGLDTIPV